MQTLELNEVLIADEQQTLSFVAKAGRLTCLAGGTAARRSRWLWAVLGLEPVRVGYITVDGEPMVPSTVRLLRAMMSYVPRRLDDAGTLPCYEAPTVQDVFRLRANRHLPISNGILAEEMRSTGLPADEGQWLAVAGLMGRPIVLVDDAQAASAGYLLRLARSGRTVLTTTADRRLLEQADAVVTIA